MKRDAKRRRDEATRDGAGRDGAGTFPATLTRRELITQDTYELDFDLLGESIDFAAGQYCRIQLPTLNALTRRAPASSPSSTPRTTTGGSSSRRGPGSAGSNAPYAPFSRGCRRRCTR